jgi:hypothetical protein
MQKKAIIKLATSILTDLMVNGKFGYHHLGCSLALLASYGVPKELLLEKYSARDMIAPPEPPTNVPSSSMITTCRCPSQSISMQSSCACTSF